MRCCAISACPTIGTAQFQPVIEELERACGIDRSDPAEARLGKLRAHLAGLGPAGEALLPHLADLTVDRRPASGHGAQAVAAAAQGEAAGRADRAIESLAARGPLLVVIEDAHWIDPSSNEFLERLIDRARSLPVARRW